MKTFANYCLAAIVVGFIVTPDAGFAQPGSDSEPAYGPEIDIGGTKIGTFYESTATGRTDDFGKPATNRFGWPESSSAVGISIPLGGASRSVALPKEFQDAAFGQYVDLMLLGRATNEADAALMADVGLQLAHGERILGRSHEAISADEVLRMAARLATEKNDTTTLERLATAAERYGKSELGQQVSAARKLGGASRAVNPALNVSVEDTTPEQYAAYRRLLQQVQVASIIGDRQSLEQIQKTLSSRDVLSADQKKLLKRRIGKAKKDTSQTDMQAADMLKRLAGESRGWDLSDLDPFNKNSGIRQAGRDFDRERLKHMSHSPRPGRDYTKIYVRNRTSNTIWVAALCVPFEWSDGHTSELSGTVDPGGSPFDLRAWYELSPDERVHVANTANVYVYFYARDKRGHTWSGKHYKTVYAGGRNRKIGFEMQMVNAPHREEWTLNFNN